MDFDSSSTIMEFKNNFPIPNDIYWENGRFDTKDGNVEREAVAIMYTNLLAGFIVGIESSGRMTDFEIEPFSMGNASKEAPQWISVESLLPDSKEGQWSKEVIALSDTGDVFKLSCMGSYWQRTKAFIESGSSKITHWMPLNYPDD